MKKQSFAIALSMMAGAALAQQGPVQFSARGIVALSDADMSASAFVDGNLYKEKGVRDALTTIQFPLDRNTDKMGSVVVSNSMTLLDKPLAVSNNGRVAFVLEGRGQVSDSVATLKNGINDLPASNAMYIVDISNAAKPTVKFRFPTGGSLTALAITPQSNALIVASADAGKELKIIEIDNTGKPTRVLTAEAPTKSGQITDLTFHPSGQFVAYSIAGSQEVGLMKYAIDNASKKPYLIAHGAPIKVGAMPGTGKFTADGKFFVLTDSKKAASAQGSGAGEAFVIQFSTEDKPGEHKIVSQAATGESPEALAISPDGATIIIANSNQSYLPFNSGKAGKSSLSVYSLGQDGKLTLANEYPFDGIMPQAVEFDKTGDAIAVAVSEYLDYGTRTGGIEFWRVTKDDKPALTKQPGRISVTRGVHALKVIQ
ncbi:hypothetical protein GCM10023187_22820 [Nibrella viscosa]|uniref:Lactonase, 7-bladed beta-propeller n=1 Tax=Nibrella viscosa TaxID=1084524 RepID=A0ABP8KEV5_9BACT